MTDEHLKNSGLFDAALMQKLEGLDLTMDNGMKIKDWFESFKDGLVANIEKQKE